MSRQGEQGASRHPVGGVGGRPGAAAGRGGWRRLAVAYWVLVGVLVVGWVAGASLLSLFALDEDWHVDRAARVVLLPLAGPAAGGLLAWALLVVTPARRWESGARSALVANGALLGCVGALVWMAVLAAH
ncbi:hypothetical protein [Kitasatospora purpeofusca]|uniref:hypothetical protein n=1 Tax=Kitasatospora purpeofusca TaxID=67352 RepID=UPI00225350F3|nr:hypothetical protein [Kitasatospora purpeofusca]MCX4754645.1 hypothetical protein [Kitasatospora purpeofusca]WSR34053.1 hypothetical protein OG715_25575 [Kitasatospora purpeofusca]